LRTALAFIGLGFVIARFALYLREAEIVAHMSVPSSGLSSTFGALMALAGVICAAYGAYRYVIGARALRAGAVSPMPDSAAVAGAVTVALIGIVVAFALPALR
jgi:putative membrane protein